MSLAADYPRTGVASVAQIENEHVGVDSEAVCHGCYASNHHQVLKRCTGCKLANYCSRECQKKQWPTHKSFCALVQGKGQQSDYLSGLSQTQVYRVVIDSYRVRVENDHRYRAEDHGLYHPGHWVDGLLWAKGDAIDDFQRYLDLAEDSGVLPKWWSFDERMECLAQAVDRQRPANIFEPVNYQQLLVAYGGDLSIQFALRIIAELIVGYDGQGRPTDDRWYDKFQSTLEAPPDASSPAPGVPPSSNDVDGDGDGGAGADADTT